MYEPDILAVGLDVIFCGLNPGASSATAGHNFANASNRFWRVLYLAGFTETCLRPQEERRLLKYGCGITAAVRRPTVRADEVPRNEFRAARVEFEAKIRRHSPRSIAFLGKRACAAMLELQKVEWGRLPMSFAGTNAWTLPNPSGLNRGFTLDALVEVYSKFRLEL